MKITELIQAYDKVPAMTVSEVLHACFTDFWFYFLFFLVFIISSAIVLVFLIPASDLSTLAQPTKEKDDTLLKWKITLVVLICATLSFFISYQLEKGFQQERIDTTWNKEHVTAFFEQETKKKENVANFTFQGKEDRSAFDRYEKKEGYVFTGFIQNAKGEVKEEIFFTETLQYDVKEGETPYIEFKYLPKTVNDEAKKGRHQIIFHVDNTILKDILKHTKKE